MHLAEPGALPPHDARVRVLQRDDEPALRVLFATDDRAGGFFHAGLLDTGLYLGVEEAGALVASAGVHVVEPHHGVAAIGNVVTRPDARGRGLGATVTASLCHLLDEQAGTIGLNVREENAPARALYERLGFVEVLGYEEAALRRRKALR